MQATVPSLAALLNPSAHSGRAARLQRVWKHAPPAHAVDWQVSRNPRHLQELVRAAQEEPLDALLLAGGDGSLHLAANALQGLNRVPLAVVPVGSGNDFARALGLRGRARPWQVLERGQPCRVDLGEVEGRGTRFCCVASVGFDQRALELIHASILPRSRLLNIYAAVRAILGTRARTLKIRWQGGGFEGRVRLAAVSNTRGYGGGFLLSPQARIDDGLLDLCIIGDLGRAELLWQFPRIFAGTHGSHPRVQLVRSPWFEITSPEGPLPVCLDGERAGAEHTPVRLRCLPGALRVLSLTREDTP